MRNQDRKKKVLFLITKSNWGGAQRYVFDLATTLPKESFTTIVALGGTGQLQENLEAEKVPVRSLLSLQRNVSLLQEIKALREIYNVVRTEKPDVLHINSSKAGVLGTLIGRLLAVPKIIFTAHGWAFNEDRPRWQQWIIKYLHWLTVLFSHHTIAVSTAIQKQMNWPLAQKKITVIYNGRKPITFLSRPDARQQLIAKMPALASHQDQLWTGTIGELHPIKRHDVMIEAVEHLVKAHLPIRHCIFGDGELRNKLRSLIEQKNLTAHVFLFGHVTEAAQYLLALDVYVQPSRSEALAYTVIEAAQAGLPIIASRVGGIPEIIKDQENGTLLPTGNSVALSEALTDYITNPEKRARHATAAERSSKTFSVEQMIEKTCAVYSSTKVSSER